VLRPQFVTIKAQNAKGEAFEIRGENLLARAFAMRSITSTEFFFCSTQHAEARPDQTKNQEAQEAGEW